MGRPALSALRALEIIDLMAGMPAQALTLSEIARMTGTNVASCHAILAVMEQRGYVLRHPVQKSYRLAPSIVAIGAAAGAHDPMLQSARRSAEALSEATGTETLLTARAGADIIGVDRFGPPTRGMPTLRIGQRAPLRPPFGGLFVAWGDEDEIEHWISPEGHNTPEEARAVHARLLALTRQRGFTVSLRSSDHSEYTRALHEHATTTPSGRTELTELVARLDNELYQPSEIMRQQTYDVLMLAAPIFDTHGKALYSLTSDCQTTMSGDELLRRAAQLQDMCARASGDTGRLRANAGH